MNNQEQSNSIKRISVGNDGSQGNGHSGSISLSDDGQLISFESAANNLITEDTNNVVDTFIYDRLNQSIELLSIATDGTVANGDSSSASISGDGNYVSFTSFASNLVGNDTNGFHDIFFRDRPNQATELISVATDGSSGNSISFLSAINDTGGYVAFESLASNLVTNDTNGLIDIFLRDRFTQTTELVSVAADGGSANASSALGSISDDGQYISFFSDADNLVAGDTNNASDIFVYDRLNQTTDLISLSVDGTAGNGASSAGLLSGDGRYVAYQSDADNLVANDTNGLGDIFVYDRLNQTTELVSLAEDGTAANAASQQASISDDGRYVAFLSDANNLVADDTNSRRDVFVRDLLTQTTQRFDADSFPLLSGDAQSLVFNSSLATLVAGDTNDTGDVFLIELATTTTETPVVEPPTTETPVVEPPTTETPVVEPPTTETPVVEPPTTETPVVEPPTTETPVVEPPTTETPVVEPPTTETPVVEPPTTETPILEPVDLNNLTTESVHRFFNAEEGFHLYTTDDGQPETIQQQSISSDDSFSYESEKFKVLADNLDAVTGEEIEGVIPVYQFFNSDTQALLYTTEQTEIDFVKTLDNYSDRGIAYYAFESESTELPTIPVFRMLNTSSAAHFYTADPNEFSHIQDNLSNFNLENQGEAVFHVLDV